MPNALEGLKQYTVVVADTGDFGSIAKFKPQGLHRYISLSEEMFRIQNV